MKTVQEEFGLTPEQASDLQEKERGTLVRDPDMVALAAVMRAMGKLSLAAKEYLVSRLNREIADAYAEKAREVEGVNETLGGR